MGGAIKSWISTVARCERHSTQNFHRRRECRFFPWNIGDLVERKRLFSRFKAIKAHTAERFIGPTDDASGKPIKFFEEHGVVREIKKLVFQLMKISG